MATTPPRRSASRIVLIVLGAIAALVGLALLVGGGALHWLLETKRDDQGYFNTSAARFSTDTYPIVSDDLDVGKDGPDWLFESENLARIRIRATGETSIFIGIGRAPDVLR